MPDSEKSFAVSDRRKVINSIAAVVDGVVTVKGLGEAEITLTVGELTDTYAVVADHVEVTYDASGGTLEQKPSKTVR